MTQEQLNLVDRFLASLPQVAGYMCRVEDRRDVVYVRTWDNTPLPWHEVGQFLVANDLLFEITTRQATVPGTDIPLFW